MNMVQLKTAIAFSLQKSMTETASVNASTMLQDFAKTQENIRAAQQASHPSLGKVVDVRV